MTGSENKTTNNLGICQGRLTTSPGNQLQWFPGELWVDEFHIASKIGYSFIELLAEREHNPENPLWTIEGKNKIIKTSLKNNLKIYSACLDYIINHSIFNESNLDVEVLEYTKIFIESCNYLGIKLIIIPLLEKSNLNKNNIRLIREFLKIISEFAHKYSIKLSIESIASPFVILKTIKDINTGCVYDTGNRALLSNNVCEEVELLSSFINHIHLKDRDKNNNNIVIGTGIVDFIKIFKKLSEIKYNGNFTFESNRGINVERTAIHNINFINFIKYESGYNA